MAHDHGGTHAGATPCPQSRPKSCTRQSLQFQSAVDTGPPWSARGGALNARLAPGPTCRPDGPWSGGSHSLPPIPPKVVQPSKLAIPVGSRHRATMVCTSFEGRARRRACWAPRDGTVLREDPLWDVGQGSVHGNAPLPWTRRAVPCLRVRQAPVEDESHSPPAIVSLPRAGSYRAVGATRVTSRSPYKEPLVRTKDRRPPHPNRVTSLHVASGWKPR
ncbi:hypothetical protein BHM03_00003570 [Ensete ventricosum]|nr:hypothetical protein BHM03_00003570 [Ensete ventricosum]